MQIFFVVRFKKENLLLFHFAGTSNKVTKNERNIQEKKCDNTTLCPSSPGYRPGAYLEAMETYSPTGECVQPAEYPATSQITHQPQPGASYPPLGTMQPGADEPVPTERPVWPRGLEYLTMIDQLLVHQKSDNLEASLSFETKNKYTIKNNLGQKVYTAKEDTGCCTRNCCGSARPFDIIIKDNAFFEIMHLKRDLRCSSCCCPCCLQLLEVSAPPGRVFGRVVQEWSILTPKFRIENASGETVLRIEGPCCTFSICSDVELEVLSTNGVKVGKITKQWSGLLREAFTDADYFGITFPVDLDVQTKAILLGALFLIDYMFFESAGDNKEGCCYCTDCQN
ncbi:phospholipid scramblase 1 [Nephila pilipes]|uniref:Phospholipid scramblase n=1 Tax=Nephila pilipes TaxID=299642 RepID=A0A8X6MYZ3_NEPPI|nr:phospholipid scramblase 1 [Nephila pilipes]